MQRYIFLKCYKFSFLWGTVIFATISFSQPTFTPKKMHFQPRPPSKYFLLHFEAIISPNLKTLPIFMKKSAIAHAQMYRFYPPLQWNTRFLLLLWLKFFFQFLSFMPVYLYFCLNCYIVLRLKFFIFFLISGLLRLYFLHF